MAWRPEHGWWRVTWRTTLAVAATVLLSVSATRAHGNASGRGGTPQAPNITSPAPRPSSDKGAPSSVPRDATTPGGTPENPQGSTSNPPEPDRPAPSGDDCDSGTACEQPEEVVDICETGDAACEAGGEEDMATGGPGDQDGP